MNKNLLLHLSKIACKLGCVLLIFIFLWITGVMIYGKLNPRFNVEISKAAGIKKPINPGYVFYLSFLDTKGYSNAGFFHLERKSSWTTPDRSNEDPFAFRNISSLSLILNYLQFATLAFCGFQVLTTFLSVINSVKRTQSFCTENARAFRKIGKFLFLIFLLTGYKIILAERGQFDGVYFNVIPLSLGLIAYIMAEIFDEGNKLAEENKLTI